LILSESRAIVQYLATGYGNGKLMPNPLDIRATARFEQAASIELTAFDVHAHRLVLEEHFKPYVVARSICPAAINDFIDAGDV
jgi:glutathione S-transferase